LSPAFAPCGIPPEALPLVDVEALDVDEGVEVADGADDVVELEPPPQPAIASAPTSNAAARRVSFEFDRVTDISWFRCVRSLPKTPNRRFTFRRGRNDVLA
jgi:hypothetical protein